MFYLFCLFAFFADINTRMSVIYDINRTHTLFSVGPHIPSLADRLESNNVVAYSMKSVLLWAEQTVGKLIRPFPALRSDHKN
jgi:hypothetical protein